MTSKSRIITLNQSYSELDKLTVQQDDLIRQALRCVQEELFRAAHVMAWAAFVDYLEEYAAENEFLMLNQARPNWNIIDIEDLKDRFGEHAIIEAMKVAKLITKGQMKDFHGLLSKRNECAHPSGYFPDLNQTLGYISEILSRIKNLQVKIGK